MRRTHLKAGRRIAIHADDKGSETVRLILHGRTESGAEHEFVLQVGSSFGLAGLVADIRDHFAALAANENSRRVHRERALRMPQEAPKP